MIKSGSVLEEFSLVKSFYWEVNASGFRVGQNDKLSDGITNSAFYTEDT